MVKQSAKAVILVIATDDKPLYRYFKKAYESYLNKDSRFAIVFTYGQGTKFAPKPYDLIFNDIKETQTPPYMAMKTIRAFEYIEENFDYEYIIRTNLSTFWIFDRLNKLLDGLPKTKCLAGRLGLFPPPFVIGSSMILSRDLIPLIIQEQDKVLIKYDKYVAEDRMISEYFTNLGIPIIEANPSFHIENLTDIDMIDVNIEQGMNSNKPSFRIKNIHNREVIDTEITRKLCLKFYNVDIGVYDANV